MRRSGVETVDLRTLGDARSVFEAVLERTLFFEELTDLEAGIGCQAGRNASSIELISQASCQSHSERNGQARQPVETSGKRDNDLRFLVSRKLKCFVVRHDRARLRWPCRVPRSLLPLWRDRPNPA